MSSQALEQKQGTGESEQEGTGAAWQRHGSPRGAPRIFWDGQSAGREVERVSGSQILSLESWLRSWHRDSSKLCLQGDNEALT